MKILDKYILRTLLSTFFFVVLILLAVITVIDLTEKMDKFAKAGVTSSQSGPIGAEERAALIRASTLQGHYERAVDRESAYEKLKTRTQQTSPAQPSEASNPVADILFGKTGPRGGRQTQGVIDAMTKSAARSIGSGIGRQVLRGVLGAILGGKQR